MAQVIAVVPARERMLVGQEVASCPTNYALQILLHCRDGRYARESPVAASRSALRSFLHYGSSNYSARNSIAFSLGAGRTA